MRWIARLLAVFTLAASLHAHADNAQIGVVLMHGKGGSPNKHVTGLAASLERHGFLVANLEMPWSGRREYDVDVDAAEAEVLAAIASLRQKGVAKVFVAGHSQGGVFALHFGSKHPVDGIVAIAPGGNVGNPMYRDKLGESVERARSLVKEGKGQEKSRFSDFESAQGTYPVDARPAVYLTWFEPEGVMNQTLAMKGIKADTPVLFVAPTNDYPGLASVKVAMFGLLPKHPLSKLYEPSASHLNAPTASAQQIEDWINLVTKP
jgi:pimeloyl-ACP methyl ester carboxylesterase